ncbi:hypothetical protein GMA8713_02130 [Grimontia marina]|uniref:Uncharacterized protein n=1 Tax=Grimontia marina TaxID=646534 RepID=A0A128F612_9GAMM|nr:hypothetical protein GMA8713_02130 [Grimontia marina]
MESIPQSFYDVDPSLRFFTFVDDVVIQYQGDTFGSAVVPL